MACNARPLSVQLRAATVDDYAAICRLMPTAQELFLVWPKGHHPLTVEQIQQLVRERKELTVAVNAETVVGFANLYDVDPPRKAFIGNVVVAASLRGQGLGKALATHMRDIAFDRYGVAEVHLSVFSENTKALLLYASLGFSPYAMEARQDYQGRRVALIHMKCAKG